MKTVTDRAQHTPERCSQQVFSNETHGMRQCSHKAVVQSDRKGWCTRHDPETGQRATRIQACLAACEGIADPSVVPEMVGALQGYLRARHDPEVNLEQLDDQTCVLLARIDGVSDGRATRTGQ